MTSILDAILKKHYKAIFSPILMKGTSDGKLILLGSNLARKKR